MSDVVPVLAIYDFRGKQEYIYRTNRMREITGASELLAGMFGRFLKADGLPGTIRDDWRDQDARPLVDEAGIPVFDDGEMGVIVYEGGGNLCVAYRSREDYVAANRVFSRIVLDEAYSLGMVAACVEWEADGAQPGLSFAHNRERLYEVLNRKKRTGTLEAPCNVLPFTQVDAVTFQPIVRRVYRGGDRQELSREAVCKVGAFEQKARSEGDEWRERGKYIDDIGTMKDDDSLIAVVYFDGNSIGEKLKEQGGTVEGMRAFSQSVHSSLVEGPEAAMKAALEMQDERQRSYRIVIDHGDEITLICNAHAAPFAIDAYFKALEGTGYHACAGMAVCHSHDPFREVYEIAESCCDSGKRRNREEQANGAPTASYVDFHYCRSGITGSLRQIRDAQEEGLVARPLKRGLGYDAFLHAGETLAASQVSRADIKKLNQSILQGDSWFALEYERIKAKDYRAIQRVEELAQQAGFLGDEALRRLLFDVTSFWDIFDLRFSRKEMGEGYGV